MRLLIFAAALFFLFQTDYAVSHANTKVISKKAKHKNTLTNRHRNARRETPPGYKRVFVNKNAVFWNQKFEGYKPKDITLDVVLNNDRTKSAKGWADPKNPKRVMSSIESFEGGLFFYKDGRPRNPRGRTGMRGRGVLGKWGPNFAADPLIVRRSPNGHFEMLAIIRDEKDHWGNDSGKWAIPGGMVDDGEVALSAAVRELAEETNVRLDMSKAEIIYKGYVDDPRNTDNAWMETTVALLEVPYKESKNFRFIRQKGEVKDIQWLELSDRNIGKLYASHGKFAKLALARLK